MVKDGTNHEVTLSTQLITTTSSSSLTTSQVQNTGELDAQVSPKSLENDSILGQTKTTEPAAQTEQEIPDQLALEFLDLRKFGF